MIKIVARGARKAEVIIHQEIGANYFGDGLTSQKFIQDLDALGDLNEIVVRINSPGGAVWDGIAIFNALKAHKARVEVVVEGLAASVASVIAMAGDTIRMGEGAMLMVHNPWTVSMGDAAAMREGADMLDQVAASMAEIYVARTGQTAASIRSMMDLETWMSGAQAVEKGFANEVLSADMQTATARAADHRQSFKQFSARCREQLSAMSPLQIAAAVRSIEEINVFKIAASTMPAAADAQAILARESERRQQIRNIFGHFSSDYGSMLDQCLDDVNCTAQAASTKLLNALGSRHEPLGGYGVPRVDDFRAAATDAICLRVGLQVEKPHAAARDLRTTSVVEIARTCLSQAGKSHRGLDNARVIKAALSTSDFPGILENALGKVLRNGYESDPQSHVAWVNRTQVPDFKTQSRLLLGSAPALLPVVEYGEYKYGALDENKTTLAISKFGRILQLSWETLINDDLGTFMKLPQAMGAAARRKEADDVYTLFTDNSGAGQTMQDSVNLFHSSHGNLSATVGAISTATLGAARALLRKQTALGNGGYLNLNPRFLIVPAESETSAEQVMAQATRHVTDTVATNTRKLDAPTPEWISKLHLVVEPRLNASYGFYVAAHYSQVDTCEVATLEADGGAPVIEEEGEFIRDAKAYKVRHTFVAKFIDWKGIVRVPVS